MRKDKAIEVLLSAIFLMLCCSTRAFSQPGLSATKLSRFTGGSVKAIVVQHDGKVVVGGDFNAYNGVPCNNIIRLDEEGFADLTFKTDGGANGAVNAMALQPNGHVLVGGYFTQFGQTAMEGLVRLKPDGSLDNTFEPGDGLSVNDIVVQPNGMIIVCGDFRYHNGRKEKGLLRLQQDGARDNTFEAEISPDVESNIKTAALQADGKIVAGGSFMVAMNGVYGQNMARFDSDGKLDKSFFVHTEPKQADIEKIVLQPDGRILTVGRLDGESTGFARLDRNGNAEKYVSNSGNSQFHSLALRADGKILLGGSLYDKSATSQDSRIGLIRLNPDLTFDPTMPKGVVSLPNSSSARVEVIAFLKEGGFLVGGAFDSFDNTYSPGIVSLKGDARARMVLDKPAVPVQKEVVKPGKGNAAAVGASSVKQGNVTPLSPVAKILFKDVKSKLSNQQKNLLGKMLQFIVSKDGKIFRDKEAMKFHYDLGSLGAILGFSVYPLDINADGLEDIYIEFQDIVNNGTLGPNCKLFVSDVNGSFVLANDQISYGPAVASSRTNGFHDLLFSYKFDEPNQSTIWKWNGSKYVNIGDIEKKQTLGLLPKPIAELSEVYQKSIQ